MFVCAEALGAVDFGADTSPSITSDEKVTASLETAQVRSDKGLLCLLIMHLFVGTSRHERSEAPWSPADVSEKYSCTPLDILGSSALDPYRCSHT